MEEIAADKPDGEEDWRPSELELAVTGDIRWSALAQAAMPRLPGAADLLRLAGVDAGVMMNEAVRATGIYDILSATAKGMWEESGFMRRFQEEVIDPLGSDAMSAKFHDLLSATGNLIKADEKFGLSGDRAFGLAAGLSRERDSQLAMDGLPDARLTGLSAIIPPAGFLLAGNARRAHTVEPLSRLFTDPFQQWWPSIPTPDRLLIGNGYYRTDYPISPVGDAAGALPDDAVLIHELRVSGGSLAQIGNLFEHFFGPARSPERCFVVRDRVERRWTIYHAEGTGRDARERARDTNSVAGYIVGVDLPVAMVEIYGISDSEETVIRRLVEHLQRGMEASGFNLKAASQGKRKMWSDTEVKLKDLVDLRRKSVVNGRININKINACHQAGIDPQTVQDHAPELYRRWYDSDYSGL